MIENIILVPKWIMAIFFFIQGSFFGSFANVLIYRMQKEGKLNLLKKSHCPHCSYTIPFYLNVPLLSWFFLRGLCKNCKNKISFRYPVVEFLMASLFSLLFLAIGWEWFLLEALIFTFLLLVASFIDLDQMILPDSLNVIGLIVGFLGAWLNPDRFFLPALYGSFLGAGFFLVVAYLYYGIRKKEGMGGGDIKMMAWIGAVLSWKALFFVVLVSCLLGSLAGLRIMLRGNKNIFQTPLPFGPFLALSALLYIFFNQWFEQGLRFFMPFSYLDF